MGWPGPVTHRQFLAWQAWFTFSVNDPGRIEYYLMQIAMEVRRGHVKKPNSLKMDQFKLNFKAGEEESNPKPKRRMTKEEVSAISKQRWLSRMTKPAKRVVAP